MAKGEINFSLFSVYWEEAGNQGLNKVDIKYFYQLRDAQSYAQKLQLRLKKGVENSANNERVIIEDKHGKVISEWVKEDKRVVKYSDV